MKFHSAALSSALLVAAALSAEAFSPAASPFARSGGTALYGVKRGRLATNVSPDGIDAPKKSKKGKKAKVQSGKKSSAASNAAAAAAANKAKTVNTGISSSLADWAASADDVAVESVGSAQKSSPKVEVAEEDVAAAAAASFGAFPDWSDTPVPSAPARKGKKSKKGNKDRRSRQAERTAAESARRSKIDSAISDLKELLDPPEDEDGKKPMAKTSFDVSYVLEKIRSLTLNPPEKGPRALFAGNAKTNYRLAWAGSDDAVCALCSGMHNVPLARLQEVFVTLGGGGRIEVLEVIRILGPFPNVRNTLKGDAQVNGKSGKVSISYDSMIDGTGKEIPAPPNSVNGIRRVELDVLYADENAVVCAAPDKEGDYEDDPLSGDGSSVLLFFREDDLDGQLNKNRVS